MRGTLRGGHRVGSADFQEEEARRANRANNMAHRHFQQTFLGTDGWSVAELQRSEQRAGAGAAGDRDDSNVLWGAASAASPALAESRDGSVVAPHAESPLLRCAFGLQHRAVLRAEAMAVAPLPENGGLDASLSDASEE